MSKFSKTLFLFTIYPIVHFTFITLVNRQLSLPSNLPLSESKTLIIGDSHTQKGLNPKLFDDAINLSQSAEPMVISYWKLKFVFDAIQPNTVIIGFGRHKISSNQDRVFYDKRTSHEFFRRSYLIGDFDKIKDIIKIDFLSFYFKWVKRNCLYPQFNPFYFLGHYEASKGNDLCNVREKLQNHFGSPNIEKPYSKIGMMYLDSMISFCELHDVKPIIISLPVYQEYYERIPNDIHVVYDSIKNKFQLKNVEFIDRANDYFVDFLFYDVDHLNIDGANIFSEEIREIIK